MANNKPHKPETFAAVRRFPWPTWTNGETHRVRLAEWDLTAKGLDDRLRKQARYRGLRVTVKHDRGTLVFKFQKGKQ
jgi:hypothetical protein